MQGAAELMSPRIFGGESEGSRIHNAGFGAGPERQNDAAPVIHLNRVSRHFCAGAQGEDDAKVV